MQNYVKQSICSALSNMTHLAFALAGPIVPEEDLTVIIIASTLSGACGILILIVIIVIAVFAKVYWTKRTRRLAIQRNRQPIPGSPVYEELTSLSYRNRTDNILLETNEAYGRTVGFR